jgi:predicted alpha-1,2-mannosidase
VYLYNYAGESYKTQYWVREIMSRLYTPAPDGYCGDEDNGQTSAWYVFSAMGFYPVCPGTNQYIIGAPLFKKITLALENGNTIVIQAAGNSDANRYVQSITLNGKAWSGTWLDHDELMKGAVIDFNMVDLPNKQRLYKPSDFPYSYSNTVNK